MGAGILAAGLVGLLTKLALVANGRRRPGRRTRRPSGEGARVELAARVGADFDSLELVDLGTRFLALQMAAAASAPTVVAVEVTPTQLTMILDAPVDAAPEGFAVGADGHSWVLDQPNQLTGFAGDLAEIAAPFPMLVSVGRSADDVDVLINLGALGLVAIEGDAQMAAETVAAAAVELATVPWSQQSRVILVGFGRSAGLGVAEPVALAETLEDCLVELRAGAADLQKAAAAAGGSSLDELRLTGDPADLNPSIVVCLTPPSPTALAELAELAANPASGLGAVVVAGAAAGGWTLEISDDGLLDIGPLARTVTAQRIPLPLIDAIEDRIAVAADPSDQPADTPVEDLWPPDADDLLPEEALIDEELGESSAVLDADLDPRTSEGAETLTEPPAAAGELADIPTLDDHTGAHLGDPIDNDATPKTQANRRGAPSLRAVYPEPKAFRLPDEAGDPPDLLVQVLSPFPHVLRRQPDGSYTEVVVGRARSLEAIVYLACHPDGVSRDRLARTFYPAEMARVNRPPSTFDTIVSTARGALGADDHSQKYLPIKKPLRLLPSVALDADILDRLLRAAETATSREERVWLLTAAFSLVGDEPPGAEITVTQRANGRSANWQWWDVEFRTIIDQSVVDVAGGLAELHYQSGDHAAASRVARRGLRISPTHRHLHSVLLSSAAARGPSYLQAAWDDLNRAFEAEAEPYDHVDEDLRHHYQDLLRHAG